jgi:hypothetical protein
MYCRPDMNVEAATKSDTESLIDRLQKVYQKRMKITFLSNLISERQVGKRGVLMKGCIHISVDPVECQVGQLGFV